MVQPANGTSAFFFINTVRLGEVGLGGWNKMADGRPPVKGSMRATCISSTWEEISANI